ncbi:hypothetical protein OLM90_17155 [Pseudomonas aeruginosa]|uniref:hypothetical protein n=1 Tax=Pseudomonas aeruginosa TaxID=287 RepID=UPI000B4B17B5|nr:hypothetical protein [Pseudomonas aeruginosa]EKV5213716.1 hypothetical protein [Pseudomonas aeruginosa]ELN9487150.1 hypothetical protein [Pseudomonas aeruginosa]ELX9570312.1 hypothetical protein [Pseudomonas aeruginosa]EME0469162.1 hypothetical protein [Pseudomonas aeruginosa]MCA4038765.1 hypothetical protein [Pseudomonas aeruginosa]
MSLYQCEICGCCENTALAAQGFTWLTDCFDWSYAPEREGKRLCSACGPTKYRDGKPTKFGKWHDQFERVFLPLGMFVTNCQGNLAHHETGDEDFRKYRIEEPA